MAHPASTEMSQDMFTSDSMFEPSHNNNNDNFVNVQQLLKMPQNSPAWSDISQFCESVIKVSKASQTCKYKSSSNKTIKRLKDKDQTKSFLQMCRKFLPDEMTQVIKWHMNKQETTNKTVFGLHMYFSSNSYNLLMNVLSLPSVDRLRHVLVPRTTQLSENFMNAMKSKIINMSVPERVCSFSVGSILLKPSLYYDIKCDRIIGFHDMDGEQIATPAKYAVVLMVQGLIENWKQPIAYTFTSGSDNFLEISLWIDEILALLINIGLDIRAFITDPRSDFTYTSDSRSVVPERTYFNVNGRNIYYIYDTMHLFKIVRKHFKTCNFLCDDGITNDFDTSDFQDKLSNLCDILNSKTRYSISPFKRAFCNEQYQSDFLREMMSLFQNLKVVRKADGVDVTTNMKFVEDFQITIKSVLLLFNDLMFVGAKYLMTSRLGHSYLRYFFKKLKESNSKKECTPRQFNKYFVRSFLYNLMKKPVGYNSGLLLQQNMKRLVRVRHRVSNKLHNKPLKIYTTDYRNTMPEKNAFVYVCGYCYLKCIQRHKCDTFTRFLKNFKSDHTDDDVTFLCSINLDFNVGKFEVLPPESFTEFLMLLEKKFKEYFQPDVQISSVGQEILRTIKSYQFDMPCPCFPIDYLKVLFVRVRLFYTLRKNNKMFKSQKGLKLFKVFSL